jgi:hypothetical protein
MQISMTCRASSTVLLLLAAVLAHGSDVTVDAETLRRVINAPA